MGNDTLQTITPRLAESDNLLAHLTLNNDTITGNSATGTGGGIAISAGNVTVYDSILGGNTAEHRPGRLGALRRTRAITWSATPAAAPAGRDQTTSSTMAASASAPCKITAGLRRLSPSYPVAQPLAPAPG